jgi:hypothetical protein
MTLRLCALFLSLGWLAVTGVRAERILWYSAASAVNETSSGATMSAAFSFELGVFRGSFVPSLSNKAEWAANWVPAQRVAYNGTDLKFEGLFNVADNTTPFTVGKAAYIWGFQGGVASSEWILFRNPAWTWPKPEEGGPNPIPFSWNAADATAVLGTIDADGVPFLMRSAAVTDAVSPPTTWQQWSAVELAGEQLNGPDDDPDRDGTSNLLEFVFGTPPQRAGAPPATPVAMVTVGAERFMQMTLPRRMDHVATLTVQVSPDLTSWAEGPTVVVSNTPTALVVRDLTPLGPGVARRFMRLKAELP